MTNETEMPREIYAGTRFCKNVWQDRDPFNELTDSIKYIRADTTLTPDDMAKVKDALQGFLRKVEFYNDEVLKKPVPTDSDILRLRQAHNILEKAGV